MPALYFGTPHAHMATGKRGRKRGLAGRQRTVILRLDETILTATPPLSRGDGRRGQQGCIPITGNRAKRGLHGALNVRTGALVLVITDQWDHVTHQYFRTMGRSYWRGWRSVLVEDRGAPHTAEESLDVAAALHMETRFLPVATPALNAMDHLWRHVKSWGLADRATVSIDTSAARACQYLLELSPRERRRKAGVLSGHFWLTL
jgi:DDE superfamily endonuclease